MTEIPAAYPVPVTLLDVYVKQIELAGRLDLIHEQLKPIADHEARIRSLERFRFAVLGATVAVSAIISALGTWAGTVLTQH